MKRIFETYCGKEIKTESYKGFVCGFSETRILAATEDTVSFSFRRLDKGTHVSEEFKDSKWRYVYCDEKTIEKYLGTNKVDIKGIKCEPKEPVNGLIK